MSQLAKFAVGVTLKKTDELPALKREFVLFTYETPEKHFEDDDVVDFRWGFDNRAEAQAFVEMLKPLSPIPDIISVRTISLGQTDATIIFNNAN
jgi:hypothetical protein